MNAPDVTLALPERNWTTEKVRVETNKWVRVIRSAVEGDPAPLIAKGAHLPPREALRFYRNLALDIVRPAREQNIWKFANLPVDVKTFVESPIYMNAKGVLYPKVLDELVELCSGHYIEGIFTGGIGTGKTTLALYAQAYELYRLSCMVNPQEEWGLDPASEIVIIFQSLTADLAKKLDYGRFKEMIDRAPYFQKRFPYRRDLESEMQFPSRIIVRPVSGSDKAAIGQNVIGGIIDEINFMAVTEKSKLAVDGGDYDQAKELYSAIARRRESRFMRKGEVYGMLCLVSSARFPGQFTDQRKEAAKRDKRIFVYDKRVWEVKPEGTFTEGRFYVFIGDISRQPFLMDSMDEVHPSDNHLVMAVPAEYRHAFEDDIHANIRDVCGVANRGQHPFFSRPEDVASCFRHHESVFVSQWADFTVMKLQILKSRIVRPHLPRFVHVDLAVSGDSCGLVVGHVFGFTKIVRSDGITEILPQIHIDGVIEIRPPKNGEINFAKVRATVMTLTKLGMTVKWITFDTFQSTDSIQILRGQGYITGTQSMDVDTRAYDVLKSAMYDGRVFLPEHPLCQQELLLLQRDMKTNKVDHPPGKSKDCSDALAGVVYGLTMRREIWALFEVPPAEIPYSVTAYAKPQSKNAVSNSVEMFL